MNEKPKEILMDFLAMIIISIIVVGGILIAQFIMPIDVATYLFIMLGLALLVQWVKGGR